MKVILSPSTRKDKKYMMTFENNLIIHFGAKGYEDYTIHKDNIRKNHYIKRHQVNEDWMNPYSPGALSAYLLWGNHYTLADNIYDFNRVYF